MTIMSRISDLVRGTIIMGLGMASMQSELFKKAITQAGITISSCQQCGELFKYMPFRDQITVSTAITVIGVTVIIAGFSVVIGAILGKAQQAQPQVQPQEVVVRIDNGANK